MTTIENVKSELLQLLAKKAEHQETIDQIDPRISFLRGQLQILMEIKQAAAAASVPAAPVQSVPSPRPAAPPPAADEGFVDESGAPVAITAAAPVVDEDLEIPPPPAS